MYRQNEITDGINEFTGFIEMLISFESNDMFTSNYLTKLNVTFVDISYFSGNNLNMIECNTQL